MTTPDRRAARIPAAALLAALAPALVSCAAPPVTATATVPRPFLPSPTYAQVEERMAARQRQCSAVADLVLAYSRDLDLALTGCLRRFSGATPGCQLVLTLVRTSDLVGTYSGCLRDGKRGGLTLAELAEIGERSERNLARLEIVRARLAGFPP